MRSNGPVLLALPAFRGLTRRIILIALIVYGALLVTGFIAPQLAALIYHLNALHPDEAPRLIWQFVTWPFVSASLLGVLFAALSLWFFGSALEDERGTRWFGELFFSSVIIGALLATIISITVGRYVDLIHAAGKETSGLWPIVLALLVVYAQLHPNEVLNFNFIFRVRAKYLAAGFLIVYIGFDIYAIQRFDALVTLCTTLSAWLFVLYAPNRGLRLAASEGWFGLRNSYYRAKRRRAAKKFTVYMRKQGKDVSIDASGRYIGLDDDDPTDRHRMN
ncbi:MAG TPA: rhomboid family intramembrane serine protease [Acidobacteriaceae bacterium]|nr:rhomboid family intramembrane serine protease [Acidobacteriaceae bacterium]